ncbi:MAG: 2-polyprenyl-3-methyl-6-methoxy-1,4-benzoquinone monooxygenase [Porticoccaceae bacterium]|jgi:3-demethoxyubiquinol 3-hydroxylase|nr:2-polyprenyl-3-methyl-6-methoxy-1,4-benzoquinone monooxygenase [Porticoccaceae bacterium]
MQNDNANRSYNRTDQLVECANNALLTLFARPEGGRPSPANTLDEPLLNEEERKRSASLMRVNHTGEVCAQALYQGQALTAKLPEIREEMEVAAAEEIDHLDWCNKRLEELDSRPSLLNPFFYAGSFAIGAVAGAISDRISLGFVAATEDQVCQHLEDHLGRLPNSDSKSRAIVEQMHEDEARHQDAAMAAGGIEFPEPVKKLMTKVSFLMTETTSRI